MNSHQRRKARRERERRYREFYSHAGSLPLWGRPITGRLQHSEPEIQRIMPPSTEEGRRLRALFFGSREPVFIGVDFADLEMRVMAARRKK